jgi:hypothetical protein
MGHNEEFGTNDAINDILRTNADYIIILVYTGDLHG